ncbi:MAG: hypothetical protein UH850_07375 [Paludibacteraceae bacterium]|nr:hypothetical protein [Paludibacteraceae bacterium]
MKNLSNLGLVEMTEQEMREVNGGISWKTIKGLLTLGAWLIENMTGDTRIKTEAGTYHPDRCICGSECPCCCICEGAWD